MITSIALGIASVLIGASVGLTGVGGFLLVPAMMVFAQSPVPDAVATALIANLGAMILTGSISVRQAAVSWRLFAQLSAASSVTAVALFPLVTTMPEVVAKILVAVFLGAMGGLILFGSQKSRAPSRATGAFRPFVVGSLAQVGAVFAGIGGPAITVPALLGRESPMPKLIGTALVHGVVVSLLGLVITTRAASPFGSTVVYVVALMVSAAVAAALARRALSTHIDVRIVVGTLAIVGAVVTLLRA